MTIEQIISKYNGKSLNANEWWPDGALYVNERIVELPWESDWLGFRREMNTILQDPIQYIADAEDGSTRTFLYYV